MAKERKKIEKKPVTSIVPKKREIPELELTVKNELVLKKEDQSEENKEIKLPFKIVKIFEGAKQEEYRAIGERVQRGEIKWLYSAIDGNKFCHHYQVIKKV